MCVAWLTSALFCLGSVLGQAQNNAPAPVAATLVAIEQPTATFKQYIDTIKKQTGFELLYPAPLADKPLSLTQAKVPFWQVVEELAEASNTRIEYSKGVVKLVPLEPRQLRQPSSVDGPFRVVLLSVGAKVDYRTSKQECLFDLEVQWEPRFPVYLLDTIPQATVAPAGVLQASQKPGSPIFPRGYTEVASVRFSMVQFDSQPMTLQGVLNVVAAERLLQVPFANLASDKPLSVTESGVEVTLQPVQRFDKRTEFALELQYPSSHPPFESFQQWAVGNRLLLLPPNSATPYVVAPESSNTDSDGRRVRGNYFVPKSGNRALDLSQLAGWKLVYETPSPLVQQQIQFQLKNIQRP